MLSHIIFNEKEQTYSYKTPQEFNMEFDMLAGEMYSHKIQSKHFEALAKKAEDQLKDLCRNTPHMTESFAFIIESRKGNVDYSKIPELHGIDLEDYRKEGTKYWKLIKQ